MVSFAKNLVHLFTSLYGGLLFADMKQCEDLAAQLFATVNCELLSSRLKECSRQVPSVSDKIRLVCEQAFEVEELWPRYVFNFCKMWEILLRYSKVEFAL